MVAAALHTKMLSHYNIVWLCAYTTQYTLKLLRSIIQEASPYFKASWKLRIVLMWKDALSNFL